MRSHSNQKADLRQQKSAIAGTRGACAPPRKEKVQHLVFNVLGSGDVLLIRLLPQAYPLPARA